MNMTSSDDSAANPYPAVDRKLLRKFREQIHALGALWIIIGSLAGVLAVVTLQGNRDLAAGLGSDEQIVLILIAGMGLVWFVLGVLTCLKHMWAVYVALVLSYGSLVGQVFKLNLCGGIILVIVILQAHRVIGWSKQMRAAGMPLTAKPE
jgi:hypothetical protein